MSIDYTLAAAKAFASNVAPHLTEGQKFRFVYTSGMMSERNQEAKLWVAEDYRKLRVRLIVAKIESYLSQKSPLTIIFSSGRSGEQAYLLR